ncbi:MAG: saccharopine dehydrogenase C-terminal domain-containing protein [Desulfosarcinaceae bacterium]|nr:saccharopine dehydrogenase C-terminal domain-containing protein [Desulfosarcinaceae bacterium]
MRVLVLGGCGIQGRAAVFDLARSAGVEHIICADADVGCLERPQAHTDMTKITPAACDATQVDQLKALFEQVDVAIDLLPRQFYDVVCQAALATGVSVVNTNYGYNIRHLDRAARDVGIALMPECGLDPGIDLVLYGEARRRFDTLEVLNSYCGGLPEPSAADNPLRYKVSWTWEGVLASSLREGRAIRDGQEIAVTPENQHETDLIHEIDFPTLGTLEAIPNGDAVFFTDLLGVTDTLRETGRYSLRWPGWCAFWAPLKRLGFLSRTPVAGLEGTVTPFDFMTQHLGPQLRYQDDEKDLVAMYNLFEGICDGRRKRLVSHLLIERDLDTGMLAMSQAVGFPASIVAQMLAKGEIGATGVLSPVSDIPYDAFMAALNQRGIHIEEVETWLD